jgi:hypothetical protein
MVDFNSIESCSDQLIEKIHADGAPSLGCEWVSDNRYAPSSFDELDGIYR